LASVAAATTSTEFSLPLELEGIRPKLWELYNAQAFSREFVRLYRNEQKHSPSNTEQLRIRLAGKARDFDLSPSQFLLALAIRTRVYPCAQGLRVRPS
jgi:hypothetical protein